MVGFATALIGLVAILTRHQMIGLFTEVQEIQDLFAVGMIFFVLETIPDSN